LAEDRKIVPILTFFCGARYHRYVKNFEKQWVGSFMMKRLQGKNLAHPGCLTGVTTGLTIGIILAGILASVFNVPYTTVLLVWFALTFGLGAIGWIIGTSLTSRFSALAEETTSTK
jgi:hypothetical protein